MQPLAARRQVDAADHLGEELAVQIGQQDADGLSAVRDQAARNAVGPEAQALGNGTHPATRILVHAVAVVEHARDGRDRDARFARNVLDRWHRRGAPEGGGRRRRLYQRPREVPLRPQEVDPRQRKRHLTARLRQPPADPAGSFHHALDCRLQAQVRRKLDRLQSFLDDLQSKAERYAERRAELEVAAAPPH